jgi:hypothetical protein
VSVVIQRVALPGFCAEDRSNNTSLRESAMTLKQNFAEQLKAQSEVWTAQVKDYQERMEQAGEKARGEYKKAMEQMQAQAEEARKLAERVRGANEAAWNDVVTASQKTFVELQRGWAEAVSRFGEAAKG